MGTQKGNPEGGQADGLVLEIRKGLLNWYDFRPGSRALYIGDEGDACPCVCREKGVDVACIPLGLAGDRGWLDRHAGQFGYLIAVQALEMSEEPEEALAAWRRLLRPGGVLLLGMNNRFGLRYFCGDRDPYTERSFDGIEGYRRAYSRREDAFRGRCYSQAEIRGMLSRAGWEHQRLYAVLPGLDSPALLYREGCLPNEDLESRLFPTYHYPGTVFLEEEGLYGGLIENGMFHAMANAYLAECPLDGAFSDVLHVTSSMERGRGDALLTIIRDTGVVEKCAPYAEGRGRLWQIVQNGEALAARGIRAVEARMEGGSCVMPYVEAESGQRYLKRMLRTDLGRFLEGMDHFRELILKSSEIVRPDMGDGMGAVLGKGYLDMVPLNSFHADGTFMFYDQEFCEEGCPANEVVWRMVATFYAGDGEAHRLLPMGVLLERYGLSGQLGLWQRAEWEFLARLRKEKELRGYHKAHRRDGEASFGNRQRMNYPGDEYERLFVDIFRNADTRKLVLFGSGQFARRFLGLYGRDYPAYAVVDNDEGRWGKELEGVPIHPPEFLKGLQSGEYKVLVCIKNYLSVMKQLEGMGVREYSIYDPGRDYPRKRRPIALGGMAGGFPPSPPAMAGGAAGAAGNRAAGSVPGAAAANRPEAGTANGVDSRMANVADGQAVGSVPGRGAAGDMAGAAAASVTDGRLEGGPDGGIPTGRKKFHVGYIAGVFDLFHVGHLNMFRRAKEQCDYLVVGVVTDEGVRKYKGTESFIPFEERIEMVRACRYVDEAVDIPLNYGGTRDAWRLLHFDCQFSGSDYADNPDWLAEKEFLEEHGAEMVFFPYTEGTSSSRIKALIEKKLL